jgi:hypothetical protein
LCAYPEFFLRHQYTSTVTATAIITVIEFDLNSLRASKFSKRRIYYVSVMAKVVRLKIAGNVAGGS